MSENLIKRGEVYYVKFMHNGHLYRQTTGETTLDRARKKARTMINKVKDGRDGGGEDLTFREWWDLYEEAYTKQKADPDRDRSIVKHALPSFGSHLLRSITSAHCQAYLAKRRRESDTYKGTPLASGTLLKERNLLQAIFQRAIENGHLEKNPWKFIPRPPQQSRERVLSWEEQQKVEGVCTEWFKRWMRFILGTGLRIEGVLGLRWDRVDLEAGFVTVKEKGRFGEKKQRDVPLLGDSAAMLKAQYEAEGHLWPEDESLFRKECLRYAQKAGVQRFSPHTLRHTFATRYLQGGGDIYILSKILGHSSVKTTETVYAHVLREDLVARSTHVNLSAPPVVPPADTASNSL